MNKIEVKVGKVGGSSFIWHDASQKDKRTGDYFNRFHKNIL